MEIDAPLSSDGEAPDEVPCIVSRELEPPTQFKPHAVKSPLAKPTHVPDNTEPHRQNRRKKFDKRAKPQERKRTEVEAKRIRRKYSLLQRVKILALYLSLLIK